MTSEPIIFGRYQLLELIAQGGMAEVFKARLVAAAGTEKLLCIKRILPTLSKNTDFISLFVREAEIALSLNHGNITQVFDFGEVDGVYYLAMEFILGQDLNAVLKRVQEIGKKLELPSALFIGTEVCKGLHYAHTFSDAEGKKHEVVHRDVTPHNILISYSGQVKLTDFGIAIAATKASTTAERVLRGKACYLSPEQVEGRSATAQSDLFSLGTVLYECMTGVRPFEGDNEKESLERIKTLQVESLRSYNSDIDEELEKTILKTLARKPEERFKNAGDLLVSLTRVLHRRWPDYTAANMAETIKDLFGWEIESEGHSGDKTRERLLYQLSRAGVKVSKNATTDELREMGTVAIEGVEPPQPKAPKAKRYWMAVLSGGALMVVLIAVLVSFFPASSNQAINADFKQPPPESISDRTEHLAPASITASAEKEKPIEASPSKKATSSHKAQKQAIAYINCNSWPWSVVYLNGRRLRGNTPLFHIKVVAGRHRLRFVNPELGLSKEVTVAVDGGDIKTVAVSLQQ